MSEFAALYIYIYIAGGRDAAGELHLSPVRGEDEAGQGGLRIRIHFIRIRIQAEYRSGSGSRGLMKKIEKKLQLKKN
jgi:hypothetical protein